MRTVRCSGRWRGGGVSARGVSAGGGGCLPQCMLGHTPLWTEFLTHTCENITFPQLRLRTVIIKFNVSSDEDQRKNLRSLPFSVNEP